MIHETTMNNEHVITLTQPEFEKVLYQLGLSDLNEVTDLASEIDRVKDQQYEYGYESADSWYY